MSVTIPDNYRRLENSEHPHRPETKQLGNLDPSETLTATIIVQRNGKSHLHSMDYFQTTKRSARESTTHQEFADVYGASQEDLDRVSEFARSNGLQVVEAHRGRRSVVVRGTATQMNETFAVELHHYQRLRHAYRGFEGSVHLPSSIAPLVETVVGLDNRPVPAKKGPSNHNPADPTGTVPLTPQKVANLYSFPPGTGAGQTIGIYEMAVQDPETGNMDSPGYTQDDIAATMRAFGGNLTVPTPTDVAVDGQQNAGVSDGETVLDITVASTVAQGANIAVYFTGGDNQAIIHALQRMIHPNPGDPVPTIISISYGWGPDDDTTDTTQAEFNQMNQLFQDAAHLNITVLVSSGDSGALIADKHQAQASYPATDPWVIACGGTTIGNLNGATFDEFVWNDTFGQGSGATGGGISVQFPVPPYQNSLTTLPQRLNTNTSGRGIPDISGNASPNSGYPEFLAGKSVGPTGGTSAVAPLFAGMMAVINGTLGSPAGFVNPILYQLPNEAFKDTLGMPGPANNSFDGCTGYPAGPGWDACTGLGSINATSLLDALRAN